MKLLDVVVVVFYLVLILYLGGAFFSKNRTAVQFTLGSGKIPSWVVTLSIFATFVSSISYLALPGSAFIGNWNPFVFSLSIPLAAVVAVKYFVPIYRKINSPSAYTFLELRFGPWARMYAAICYLLTQLMRIGTILYLLAVAINAIVGWDIIWVIIITGIFVSVYSILGGIEAVLWADAIQAILLIIGAIACLLFIQFQFTEGFTGIIESAMKENKFSLGSFDLGLDTPTFWVVLVYGVFINLQNFGIDQNYIQRYMVLSSDKKAKYAAFFGGLIYLPVSALFLFIGTALYVFFQKTNSLPLAIQSQGDKVFPYFIAQELPSGFSGLLIASIFAAGMSTISTSFNSMATVFLTDFYTPKSKDSLAEQAQVKILYRVSVIIGLAGISVALIMIDVKGVLDSWWKFASIFSGGMLGLFLLGITTTVKSDKIPLYSVLFGVAVILWMTLSPYFPEQPWAIQAHAYLTIVIGTAVIFILGFVLLWMKKTLYTKDFLNRE